VKTTVHFFLEFRNELKIELRAKTYEGGGFEGG